jgi:hypothetical protein
MTLLHVGAGVVNDMGLVRDLDIPGDIWNMLKEINDIFILIETCERSCSNTGPPVGGGYLISDGSRDGSVAKNS